MLGSPVRSERFISRSQLNVNNNSVISLEKIANSSSSISNSGGTKKNFKFYYNKCLKRIAHSINIIQALMMRLIFSLHSLISISYVYLVKQDEWYLVNVIGVIFLFIELFVTVFKRKGKEPRWYFPCFAIYIFTMIPPIWFVELARINQANMKRMQMNNSVSNNNNNNNDFVDNIVQSIGAQKLSLNISISAKKLNDNDSSIGIEFNINSKSIAIDQIAIGLELSLLLLIIMGRWFLPKGNISRIALSQLLLVYMSLASDIVDLLSLLNEVQVQESNLMHYFTLSIFSWSLIQFSLNLVVQKGQSFQSFQFDSVDRNSMEDEDTQKPINEELSRKKNLIKIKLNSKRSSCLRWLNFDNEIWSILITILFQDGPFLALRLIAVFRFGVRTYQTMFFTFKNAIILFIQMYRLFAILTEKKYKNKKNPIDDLTANKANVVTALKTASMYLDKYIILCHLQNLILKKKASSSARSSITTLTPIKLRSSLNTNYSYVVVLTPNINLTVSCCKCGCHLKES